MKANIEIKDKVAKTLFIPLYMRAKEYNLGDSAIIKDKIAFDIVNNLDYDFSWYEGKEKAETVCNVSSWYFDNTVKGFIARNDNPVVVNIGCGLDALCQRIGSPEKAIFYDIDLPEVIEIRKSLISESRSNKFIATSGFDTEWMDNLSELHKNSNFIFIIHGVLMYFPIHTVHRLLKNLALRFNGEIWFNAFGRAFMKKSLKPDALKHNDAQIKSAITYGSEIEKAIPELELIEQANYLSFFRNRWGFLLGHILGRLDKVSFRFMSLLGYRIVRK